jgi:uncharacterized protein with HEPN domain
MDRIINKYLWDVLDQIKFIEEVTAVPMTFNEFEKSMIALRSVERSFEIIGEAIKRALASQPDLVITDTKKIIGMRNILAHGYDMVSPSTLWVTIKKSLPELKTEVEQLLKG